MGWDPYRPGHLFRLGFCSHREGSSLGRRGSGRREYERVKNQVMHRGTDGGLLMSGGVWSSPASNILSEAKVVGSVRQDRPDGSFCFGGSVPRDRSRTPTPGVISGRISPSDGSRNHESQVLHRSPVWRFRQCARAASRGHRAGCLSYFRACRGSIGCEGETTLCLGQRHRLNNSVATCSRD